jgi:hypothetical protein
MKNKNLAKLRILADLEGEESFYDMLQKHMNAPEVPGICSEDFCDFIMPVPAQSKDGWCPACLKESVVSCLVLGNVR